MAVESLFGRSDGEEIDVEPAEKGKKSPSNSLTAAG